MNYVQMQQSQHKQRTGILLIDKQNGRKKSPKKTYSRAIHPLNLQTKPMSTKNLEIIISESSVSSFDNTIEDNKSCCCLECGIPNKKAKHLRKRFRAFVTSMSILKRQRLVIRFRNAAFCILYLVQRRKKLRILEKKKMFRFKTKVFLEGSPLMQPMQSSQVQHSPFYQNHDDKNQQSHQHTQSIQAKIIDQRHKQRQSVQMYLQQKLHEKDNQVSLPKINGKCSQTSFSTQIIQPLRFKDDSKTSRYISHTRLIQQTEYSPTAIAQSPYLNQFGNRNDQLIQSSFCKTARPGTKSISQEVAAQKQMIHQRKNTAATLKGLV